VERSSLFAATPGYLNNVKVLREEVIRPRSDPFGPDGGVAVLRGSLAPAGAVVKYFSVPPEMHVHVGPARVFDFEDAAVEVALGHAARLGRDRRARGRGTRRIPPRKYRQNWQRLNSRVFLLVSPTAECLQCNLRRFLLKRRTIETIRTSIRQAVRTTWSLRAQFLRRCWLLD